MLDAALKAGWTQIGPGVPVFFKCLTEPQRTNWGDYYFEFVTTCDYHAYYDLYNVWIEAGRIKREDLNINRIFGSAFTTVNCTISQFAEVSNIMISDYYHYTKNFEKREYYINIAKTIRDATNRIQEQVCDQPVSTEGLEKHVSEAVVQSVDTGKA